MSPTAVSKRISVIMPCYNASPFVEEAVGSVMNQTYPDVELVVVDDGSTDGSVEILQQLEQRYGPRLLVLHQYRLGPYPARNLGLAHCSGRSVAFLDADDYWSPDILEKLAATMDANGADIVYCGWQNVGEGWAESKPIIPPDFSVSDRVAEFLRACPWPIQAVLVRREAIGATKGFSERCFSAMDYDLWLRLCTQPCKFARVPEVLAYYRWHEKKLALKSRWKQVLDALQVRREFVAQFPSFVSHLPEVRVKELSDGFLLSEAFRFYWQRNLYDAQMLFRCAIVKGLWTAADLKYLLPALLPGIVFRSLVRLSDRLRNRT